MCCDICSEPQRQVYVEQEHWPRCSDLQATDFLCLSQCKLYDFISNDDFRVMIHGVKYETLLQTYRCLFLAEV